ncbi:hypothetical protein ABC337_09515 [Arthrobacter sp. 1P04PC]|uniref:hypothetical protein n=1 Tax=unclassified Arthrobacter TaxID=235627 RepID=UPI0039A34793
MKVLTHAPADLVIGTSDGVDVRFAGAQLKDTPGDVAGANARRIGIHLSLSGVRGEETMSRDVLFERDRYEWAERRKAARADATENAPAMPGVAVFERLTTVVSDDLGTEYQWSGGQVAGGGTEWEAHWIYTPAPPAEARTLRFEFSIDGQPTGRYCELKLSESDAAGL